MVLTPSTMMPLGTLAPDFTLQEVVSGQMNSLTHLKGEKGTVLLFICNHCPFVKHINTRLVQVAELYQTKGIQFIGINANDTDAFPEDSPQNMKKVAQALGYPFPYLYDETQEVAKAYDAACTPDIFLFDPALKCVYRGQFDESRPGQSVPVTGSDLCAALDHLLAKEPIDPNQKPSIGCNIKWKAR